MPGDFSIFLLYLFYGMAFFAIGVSITSRDTHASNLKIAGVLWLLALFAYSHAFHEWLELYENLSVAVFSKPMLLLFNLSRVVLLFVSFGFLLLFGLSLLRITFPERGRLISLLPAVLVLLLLLTILRFTDPLTAVAAELMSNQVRNFIGLPAAFCAGFGLIFYSRTLTQISGKGARNFFGAGIALIVYGFLAGVVPSGTRLPVVAVPIELMRGISAFVILHFVMNALYTFDEERKQMIEEQLTRFAKAEKLHALGRLACGIAHEINNPLTNVSMTIEMLKSNPEGLTDRRQAEKRFAMIERNLERASKIARELLAFSTEREAEFVPTSLNTIVDSALELLGSRRNDYRIEVVRGDLAPIPAIPWKLEEVFLNLLVNAMDATPAGGTISITTHRNGPLVQACISDSGSGIPKELLGRVMDPFFTTKAVGQGTGLGLSICYGIMELHGGSIELATHEGQGTSVTLTFPQGDTDNG